MAASQAKKRGNFQLDIEDMPRHMVDLRRDLDREKRRFQAAKMVNEFEDQLRKVLRDLNGQGQDPAGANGDTNAQPQNSENGIHLTVIDRENLNRLLVFLKYTIEMCQRTDQQELMQEVLRSALQDTRRKRFKTQQEVPGTAIEPFCLFCASDINGVMVTNCHDQSHRQQQPVNTQPQAITGIISMPRVELVHLTPPPSAMPTPDVGDQAGIYTPNINPTTTVHNHQNNATPSPTLGQTQGMVQKATGLTNGLMKKTNASEAAAAASAARTAGQPPSTSPASSGVVGPSDVDESSSDNEPASLQDVVEWAERSRLGAADGDDEPDDHRSSTPLRDDPERTMSQLVIDESSQESHGIASPIYRPEMKAANSNAKTSSKSIKTMFEAGKAIAGGSSLAATSSLSRSVEIKSQPSQASRSESTTARPTMGMSVANLSTMEQSQPSQQIRGASSVRTKFHPKRRNRND